MAASAAAVFLMLFLAIVSSIFGFLPAISLYHPEKMHLGDFRFPKGEAKWNPAKHHVILFEAASWGTAVYLFAVIFKVISNFERDALSQQFED